MNKKPVIFIFSIVIPFIAAAIGSYFTTPSIPTWYASLQKPAFSPPNWIFAPVWTLLYLLMGISLYLILTQKSKQPQKPALTLFAGQLILNTLWSVIFFGLKSPFFALIDIILLLIVLALTIKAFSQLSLNASYLLYPYFAWVAFATILNLSILILN